MDDFREKSFWLSTQDYTPNLPLTGEITADAVVIGGGFTGLSTAFHLKQMEPSLDVILLESNVIGYGASGRNAGFAMTLFGFSLSFTKLRYGKERTREAHHFMERAVDYTHELITSHSLDCEYEFPGFLRVATSPKYEKRIQKEIELAQELELSGISWIDRNALLNRVNSDRFLGAWYERRAGLLNPAKFAWEMKQLCESQGVKIFENTSVESVELTPAVRVSTDKGLVLADKVMFATNAYSQTIPHLKRKQIPVITQIVLTRPLTEEELEPIFWHGREGIEDARNLVHYFRLTSDNRLLMGGGNVGLVYGYNKELENNSSDKIFQELRDHVSFLFPHLENVEFTHQWGGPVSVPIDFTPAIGYIGDCRCVYSLGCVGHGVSLTQLNGRVSAELLLEEQSDLTDVFFVNRKIIPWPPEPIRFGVSKLIRKYMAVEDRIYERV